MKYEARLFSKKASIYVVCLTKLSWFSFPPLVVVCVEVLTRRLP